MLGISMLRGTDPFSRVMGGVAVAFGIYYALKPFLGAYLLAKQRRASGAADREITLVLGSEGIEIDDTRIRTRLGWDEIRSAGRGSDYVWYELQGGQRATIPLRVVTDLDALVALFDAHCEWQG